VALTLDQFPLLTGGLPAKALLGDLLGSLRFGVFERVQSTPNGLPIDAVLVGKVGLGLTGTNTPAYVLDVFVGQFERRSHALSLPSWDISWDISGTQL
jgi:hypothetical protein